MNTYPLPKFHFRVEWAGGVLGFTEVTGLDSNRDRVTRPGTNKYPNITFKRGAFVGDTKSYNSFDSAVLHSQEKRDVTISLLNEKQAPVRTWKVVRAIPVKVQAADLKAEGNEVAIESIEISYEELVVQE